MLRILLQNMAEGKQNFFGPQRSNSLTSLENQNVSFQREDFSWRPVSDIERRFSKSEVLAFKRNARRPTNQGAEMLPSPSGLSKRKANTFDLLGKRDSKTPRCDSPENPVANGKHVPMSKKRNIRCLTDPGIPSIVGKRKRTMTQEPFVNAFTLPHVATPIDLNRCSKDVPPEIPPTSNLNTSLVPFHKPSLAEIIISKFRPLREKFGRKYPSGSSIEKNKVEIRGRPWIQTISSNISWIFSKLSQQNTTSLNSEETPLQVLHAPISEEPGESSCTVLPQPSQPTTFEPSPTDVVAIVLDEILDYAIKEAQMDPEKLAVIDDSIYPHYPDDDNPDSPCSHLGTETSHRTCPICTDAAIFVNLQNMIKQKLYRDDSALEEILNEIENRRRNIGTLVESYLKLQRYHALGGIYVCSTCFSYMMNTVNNAVMWSLK